MTPVQDGANGAHGDVAVVEFTTQAVPTIAHIVTFSKDAGRALDDGKSDLQLSGVMQAARTADRQKKGWTIDFREQDAKPTYRYDLERAISNRYAVTGDKYNGYVYSCDVDVICAPSRLRATIGQEFDNIVASMDQKAQLPGNRWRVSHVDGKAYVPKDVQKIDIDANEDIGYAPFELPDEQTWLSGFDHLYGLDDYIAIIRATLEAAIKTGWRNRVNIALIGPPACGKSELCKAVKKLVGEESVLEFDGTSTTMAGAQQNLAEREELPRVLLVEEIEKAPEASLQWLLSVLDLRGEVRKTTARGNILKSVHMVGICTVNNQEVFDKLASGALASRFSMPLHFQRPPREILWKILNREVNKMDDGDEAWIEATLDYAEKAGIGDPRKLIAICLTGREKLLDGSYQRMLERTAAPRDATFTPHGFGASRD